MAKAPKTKEVTQTPERKALREIRNLLSECVNGSIRLPLFNQIVQKHGVELDESEVPNEVPHG